jgi:hypothetical protein
MRPTGLLDKWALQGHNKVFCRPDVAGYGTGMILRSSNLRPTDSAMPRVGAPCLFSYLSWFWFSFSREVRPGA